MKLYIADFVPNVEVTSYFLVVDTPTIRKSKKGTDYACLELVDMTGKIEARIWEMCYATLGPGLDVKLLAEKVVKARGMVSKWDGKLQMSISNIRPIESSDDVEMGDLFERSVRDPEAMWDELQDIVYGMSNSYLKELLRTIILKNKEDLKRAPAAMRVHNAYIGGLIEHVLSMCQASIQLARHYGLNEDLLLAGCVLHDIGKIRELTYDFGIGYSLEGTLIGHIPIGMEIVSRAIDEIDEFPRDLKVATMHLIASHHGLLAYGSPKVPLMREAIALYLLDMLDSKMFICDRASKSGIDAKGLTAWVKELEGPLWRGPE